MNASRSAAMMDGEAQQARGKKRDAEDALEDEQRFAKRFNLLNLAHKGKLYIPLSPTLAPQRDHVLSHSRHDQGQGQGQGQDEHMQLDDTKHRVYIHDLDEELADVESDEEKLIFLPDIEKKLGKIPRHVLTGSRQDEQEGQELVLYSVPSSLTVPEERDSVRKAIVESRQRARDKAAHDAKVAAEARNPVQAGQAETAHGYGADDYNVAGVDDPDAMDIG